MGDRSQIAGALANVELAFAEMAAAVDAQDLEQRRLLIAVRRRMSEDLVALNHAVDAAVSGNRIDLKTAVEYHAQSSAFRRAVSLHQAEWPTILISDDMAGYVAASKTLRRKREAFVAWVRTQFLPKVAQ